MKPPKLRWLFLFIAAVAIWRACTNTAEVPPVAELISTPEPVVTYAPARRGREAIVLETPTPDGVGIEFAPSLVGTPRPLQAAGIFESVAFKNEEEVLELLGEPDAAFEQGGRISWYYSKPAFNRQGKPVCPELQFMEDEARMVIMWPPDKMKKQIALVRRLKAEGAQASKGPATFTFSDSFKYLGVGTPQATVREDLGEPDSKKIVEGREEWNYDTLIIENGASRRLTVVLQKGKVVEVRGR